MIRIGILGYGNLGRGVESAIRQNPDMELAAVFTRRDPASLKIRTEGVGVYSVDDVLSFKDKIDVMILCGGSATDLPVQTPLYAKDFNVINSFDTHARISEHFADVDKAAKEGGKVGVISACLPEGQNYTFWGRGVSQGHSDACRRIEGVKDARQYTVPVEESVNKVRNGENPDLTTRQMHTREAFVVAEEGADKEKIEEEIKTMPNYFADYDTTVTFISEEEMKKNHAALPHGGFVIRSGVTGFDKEHKQIIEYNLKLDSNPEFTGSILVAYARAAFRLYSEGQRGCKTIFDIPPAYLSPLSGEELRAHLL